ncbi:hypothetical protein ABT390_20475 [Streptomyces aurantiacus]|uniref:Lipoprotein n=1 Tax=Streptomyces aurantiacus JA 4570 TaxID=1286094 RepID=S3Z882_9ACTN|nr:hypothetical protein [Streptomyces aurantiacus]EPH39368.1 hypothetical protein STRAU_7569 [Streptomyces aurantiacus JA 4570]
MELKWGKRGVRWAAAAVAVVALAGCAAEKGDSGRSGGAAHGSGVPEVDEDKDLPELPLDRYEFSARDYEREQQAADRLAQRCMKSHGFPDFPRQWREHDVGMSNRLSAVLISTTLYGSLDLDEARHLGYGLDQGALKKYEKKHERKGRLVTPDEYKALRGEDAGRDVPEGGCAQAGTERVRADVKDEARLTRYIAGRRAALDKAVAKDPRMRRSLDEWADCVVDKGFKRYASPEAAFRDKAWGRGNEGDTKHTRRERDTAVADVECKREHNTAGVWWSVAAEHQRRDIARHRSAYEAVRADLERVRATVRGVLEGGARTG